MDFYRFFASRSILAMWQHYVSAMTRTSGSGLGRGGGFGRSGYRGGMRRMTDSFDTH